uniref:Uncharacterized protein n=1 Tax=Romanomermis culicivorax TaxID=13658 RepID=A0A915IZU2_ROMCU
MTLSHYVLRSVETHIDAHQRALTQVDAIYAYRRTERISTHRSASCIQVLVHASMCVNIRRRIDKALG